MAFPLLSYLQTPLFWVVAFLCTAVILFIQNKIRMDVIALLVMLAFSLSGILNIEEIFAGFSDPNIILIALLFVVGEGLVRTGVAYQVSEWLMRVAGKSETKVLILLMLAVATLGSFMSSTGVVAIFIPVVVAICRQMNIPAKRLMMPLSVAGLISGMMTLIATAPNLVVNAALIQGANTKLSFFSFTPIGALILVAGIIYMLLTRRWLSADSEEQQDNGYDYSINDLIEEYCLQQRVKRLVVRAGSPFIGQPVEELHLRSHYGINIVAIERWKRFRPIFMAMSLGKREIREKDILLTDISNSEFDLAEFCQANLLEPAEIRSANFGEQAKSIGLVEVTPVPDSTSIGQSVTQLRFRSHYGLNVVGLKRNNEVLSGAILDEPIKLGDLLLVIGDWKLIREMRDQSKKFFMLNYPSEIEKAVPARSQAMHALFSVLVMVGLMVSGLVHNVIAALFACILMGKFRCIDGKSAYASIHWPSLILIIGMMPFSIALQKTGGVDLIVNQMLQIVGGWDVHLILMSLFLLVALVGLFISNTATAILTAPIAITMAHKLHFAPEPFAMVVAIAASAAFITPISSPVNTMVLGPGNYKFADFVKNGVPFTLIVMLISVLIIPLLLPLN